MSLENKTTTYNTPLDLLKYFVINGDLHLKYFKKYQLLYTHDGKSPRLIYFESVDSYRDVTDLDLMELQVDLMLNENINVRNFSILSQALINYLHRYNNETNFEKIYEDKQNTEEEILLDLIYKINEENGYVSPKQVLTEFGLKQNQFKQYDQKLSKLFKNEGFEKFIKKKNNIRVTCYRKST